MITDNNMGQDSVLVSITPSEITEYRMRGWVMSRGPLNHLKLLCKFTGSHGISNYIMQGSHETKGRKRATFYIHPGRGVLDAVIDFFVR